MKKIVYSILALAIAFTGVNAASADEVYIPMIFHYGSNDYTQINIKNNSAVAVRVSVSFNTNLVDAQGAATNTATATEKGAIIAGNSTWTLLTKDTDIFGTTTNQKRCQVIIQSSDSNVPATIGSSGPVQNGPITVGALFIDATSANPSGFSFPAFYRTRSWASTNVAIATTNDTTQVVDNWEQ